VRALGLAILHVVAGCGEDRARPLRPPPGPATGQVTIHVPERLRSVPTGELDSLGRPLRAACVTCHSLRPPAQLPASVDELDEFHQGLTFAHGALTCASCHVAGDQDRLRRADGTTLPMVEAIALCAQCHGPQFRDYQHGAHGGMNGAWDLSSGDRVRNHCVDCHDPHAPAFLPSMPVLPPHDRGLVGSRGDR
jgi:formate-dependent nitrite reductase cytochrome c552 subunit